MADEFGHCHRGHKMATLTEVTICLERERTYTAMDSKAL